MENRELSPYTYGTYVIRQGAKRQRGQYLSESGAWAPAPNPERKVVRGFLMDGKVIVGKNLLESPPKGSRFVRLRPPKNLLKTCLEGLAGNSLPIEGLRCIGRSGVLRFLKTGALKSEDKQPDVFTRFVKMVRDKKAFDLGARILWSWVESGHFPKTHSEEYFVSSHHHYPTQIVAGWVHHMLQEAK